jgi:hypothetical protein
VIWLAVGIASRSLRRFGLSFARVIECFSGCGLDSDYGRFVVGCERISIKLAHIHWAAMDSTREPRAASGGKRLPVGRHAAGSMSERRAAPVDGETVICLWSSAARLMASRARSTMAANGPTAKFAVADSTPACGRVGAIFSAARTAAANRLSLLGLDVLAKCAELFLLLMISMFEDR